MKRLFLLSVVLLLPAPLAAQELAADSGQVHVVRRGDTLWDLARQYLANPFRWSEIYGLNRDVVADPHWIYPAERIRIPGASVPGVSSAPVSGAPVDAYDPQPAGGPPPRTVFFPASTAQGSAQLLTAADAQNVTIVTEGDYYTAGLLVPDAEVQPVGELVELAAASVVPLRRTPQIQPFSRVFMKLAAGRAGEVRVGDVYHLWRRGAEVGQYGRIYVATGSARVVAVDGDVATVEVDRLFDSVQLGDLALPVEPFPVPGGVIPGPAANGLQGRILAFAEPQAVHGVEDVAYLDLGEASGVTEGDEFAVVIPARRTSYGIRPEMEVARLQVVRVAGRTSAARVIAQQQPALEAGQVVRLVGKMP
jgi:hypothetical protein